MIKAGKQKTIKLVKQKPLFTRGFLSLAALLFRGAGAIMFLLLCLNLSAQDFADPIDSIIVTQPTISFPSDLDSLKIDSFFFKRSIDLRQAEKPDLYYEVYRWYRTCYRWGGNSDHGIDCSHFVNMLYEKIYGITIGPSAPAIYAKCKVVKGGIKDAREGDLIFFKIKRGQISHVGIYLQNGSFAHATTKVGVVISKLSEPYYRRYFYKIARVVLEK